MLAPVRRSSLRILQRIPGENIITLLRGTADL